MFEKYPMNRIEQKNRLKDYRDIRTVKCHERVNSLILEILLWNHFNDDDDLFHVHIFSIQDSHRRLTQENNHDGM
jgi:hypothetical protein